MEHISVAHLTPTFFAARSVVGGGERYVSYLARALATAHPGAAFRQVIISCGERDETFVDCGILVRVLRNDNPAMGAMNSTSRDLINEIRGFDLVHVHQILTLYGAFATTAAVTLGIPVIGTDHGGGTNELMLRKGGLHLLAGIVSDSSYAHRLIAPHVEAEALILSGPVDTGRFTPAPSRAPGERPRLLCVGRLLPHKGVDRVIAALPDGLSLTVAGRAIDGRYAGLLRTLAAGKDVTFIHDADDERLLALYRESDVFIQASTHKDCYGAEVAKPELLGLTTLEAMSCGVPFIVSDAGALPDLATDDRFARVFRTGEELERLLGEIRAGAWPQAGASQLARREAETRYGLMQCGEALGRFYRKVAGQVR